MSTAVNEPNDRGQSGPRSDRASGITVGGATTPAETGRQVGYDRDSVLAREKEEHGGIKFGAAFFGWLTAAGTTVLLTALVAGIGTALGLGAGVDVANPTADQMQTVGLASGIALLVIILVAYFCGGYVAGRMSRFSGAKQGLAVWLWALIVAVVLIIVGAIAGQQFNLLSRVSGLPQIPSGGVPLNTVGIVLAVAVVLVSLGGAVLGGIVGMRYHRRVDSTGFGM